MTKLTAAALLALGALSAPAFAADLIIEQAPAVAAASSSDVYVQLLGGAALEGTYDYDGSDFSVPASYALAGVIGFGTGIEGLSIEADGFYSQSDYEAGSDDYTLTVGAAMAALKYTVDLTEGVSLYGAVGVGGLYLRDEDEDGDVDTEGWGAGYLLKAGLTVDVAESIALVGEVRYTDTFDSIEDVQKGTTSVLVGLQIGF
jgi:opacity protein-like surface antigen